MEEKNNNLEVIVFFRQIIFDRFLNTVKLK